MGCKGKCQLSKRLQQIDTESQHEKSPAQTKINIIAFDLFFEYDLFKWSETFLPAGEHCYGALTDNNYYFNFRTQNFKPPVSIIS